MSEGDRIQFRVSKSRYAKLIELARSARISPHQMAKAMFERAIDRDPVDPQKLSEDLLVIRAGVEQLFRRADRQHELADAVDEFRTRRNSRGDTLSEEGRS